MLDWAVVDSSSLSGSNLSPQWPQPALSGDERLGEESEEYTCVFEADGKTYRYETDSSSEFQSCEIGATFTLDINTIGGVVSIQ